MNREPYLPDFKQPPVVETVLGVSFPPLEQWKIPHFGLYWREIRGEYQKVEVHPPIGFAKEKFGPEERVSPTQPSFQVLEAPDVRCWFINEESTRLLQVQRDAFLHNWRKTKNTEAYPHYEHIRPIFEREWQRFSEFLNREGIPGPTSAQCEITYVNHIERDGVWRNFADVGKLLPSFSPQTGRAFLPEPDALSFTSRFPISGVLGRLHVSLQPAFRSADGKPILELKLTARGAADSANTGDILSFLDIGREWIVRGFTDLTSELAHQYWERTR
jgi:uncharacterized protein (TIGR04255 family)